MGGQIGKMKSRYFFFFNMTYNSLICILNGILWMRAGVNERACECICALCNWTACAGDIRRVFPHVHNLALKSVLTGVISPKKKDLWQKPWQTAWPGSPFRLPNSFGFRNGLLHDSEIANAWSDEECFTAKFVKRLDQLCRCTLRF